MMEAAFFCIVFVGCLSGIMCCPGKRRRRNGVKALVLGIYAILCGQAALGLMLARLNLRVRPGVIGGVMLVAGAGLWYDIWRKKRIQKLFWGRAELAGILLLAVFVLCISGHIFGVDLGLTYPTATAAEKFAAAMRLVRGQGADSAGFATVVEAIFIELAAPLLPQELYYKGFILADIFLHIMELWMFYVTVIGISGGKRIVRVFAPLLSLGYFWGYPAYNYMAGNDDSFAICSMFILALMNVRYMPEVQSLAKKAGRSGRMLIRTLPDVLLVCGMLVRSLRSAGTREIYASMYADLIFFVPLFLYVCYWTFWKKKRGRAICEMSVAALVCTVVLYGFWYQGRISNYDYYQNYAVLWLFGWLLIALALGISAENGELPQLLSYGGMLAVLSVAVLSGYAKRVAGYDGEYVTKNLFSLYRYNADCLLADYSIYRVSEETLELYGAVLADYDAYNIPILTEDIGTQTWYDALTDHDSTTYSLVDYGLEKSAKQLEEDGIPAVIVQTKAKEYQEYSVYFEQCEELLKSETAALYESPGDGWLDTEQMDIPDYDAKVELFCYVRDYLGEEQVPLMAGKESCREFILYGELTGNVYTEYYTWNYNEKENVLNLNLHGVKYVTLLADDVYYLGNQGYYSGQKIVFENEAGMVVRCAGESWFLGE